ncbi:MAG: DUF302 domain-containing protein [Nitrospirales bacterium]|nr:DUF302 domain-containing protein [Nitrospirales bacterium]
MRVNAKGKVLGMILMSTALTGFLMGCETMGMGGGGGMMAMPKDRAMAMSKYSFEDTVSRIKQTIESRQMMVVFTADHQAMLSMAGLNTKGMQGIEFFHPRYGKKIMQNDHRAGIEIPLRLVVMETPDGKAMLSFYKPSSTFAKYKGLEEMARELDGVYDAIVAAVSR